MHRTIWPSLFLGLTSVFTCASANFGFTSANFDYVQLSSPQVISWNGQSGEIILRLMVYPSDQELSYLPIAANLSGNSYTWVPTSLATGSTWTLEGIDEDGNIAASQSPFSIQGTANPNAVSASLMQQNPQSTAQPTTLATAAATTTAQTTSTAEATSTTSPVPPSSSPIPTNVKIAIAIGVGMGVAGLVTLSAFFILRYRQKTGRSLMWSPFRSTRRSRSTSPFELQDNDSVESLHKPIELQGSHIEGTSETSAGSRMELGFGGPSSRQIVGQRISLASGAVETSMGKRMELG